MAYTATKPRLAQFGPFGDRRARTGRRLVAGRRSALGDVDATFQPSTEAWRDLVSSQAGDKPIDFLMAWIDVESAGNPCSFTKLQEAGIFQLEPPDNMTQGGTTLALQHPVPPCATGMQTPVAFSQLTSDQANEQVRGGLQYVDYCRTVARADLNAAGYTDGWSDTDASFWQMVKMVHVAPAAIPGQLAQAVSVLGFVPPDWATWRATTTAWPASWLDNAEKVGAYGAGGGSVIDSLLSSQTNVLLIAGSVLALTYLWSRS